MKIRKGNIKRDRRDRIIITKEFTKIYPTLTSILCPENIAKIMNDVFEMDKQVEEYVYLVCLDNSDKPIFFFEISHGTCDASLIGIWEILVRALLCDATNILVIHNHPGGFVKPSDKDVTATEQIRDACEGIGVNLLDHIILAGKDYYSILKNKCGKIILILKIFC